MAKVDLGEKRVCPECASKFYDLTKRPAVCPKCEFSYDPDAVEAVTPVPVAPLQTENESADTDAEEQTEEELDEAEAEAKELELDGDDANFGGVTSDDDEGRAPDINTFDPDEDKDEDAALVEDEEDELPPTGKEDEDPEEVEI